MNFYSYELSDDPIRRFTHIAAIPRSVAKKLCEKINGIKGDLYEPEDFEGKSGEELLDELTAEYGEYQLSGADAESIVNTVMENVPVSKTEEQDSDDEEDADATGGETDDGETGDMLLEESDSNFIADILKTFGKKDGLKGGKGHPIYGDIRINKDDNTVRILLTGEDDYRKEDRHGEKGAAFMKFLNTVRWFAKHHGMGNETMNFGKMPHYIAYKVTTTAKLPKDVRAMFGIL